MGYYNTIYWTSYLDQSKKFIQKWQTSYGKRTLLYCCLLLEHTLSRETNAAFICITCKMISENLKHANKSYFEGASAYNWNQADIDEFF